MRRFSIRTLMATALISAVFLAALRNAEKDWERATTTLTLALITLGAVHSKLHRGKKRRWWLGFALAGSTYLVVSFTPLAQRLYTTQLLEFVHDRVVFSTIRVYGNYWSGRNTVCFFVDYVDGTVRNFEVPASVFNSASPDDLLASFEPVTNRWRSAFPGAANRGPFERVGQNVFSLLAGLIGAAAFTWPYRTGH
jgi:hypothetical protein